MEKEKLAKENVIWFFHFLSIMVFRISYVNMSDWLTLYSYLNLSKISITSLNFPLLLALNKMWLPPKGLLTLHCFPINSTHCPRIYILKFEKLNQSLSNTQIPPIHSYSSHFCLHTDFSFKVYAIWINFNPSSFWFLGLFYSKH